MLGYSFNLFEKFLVSWFRVLRLQNQIKRKKNAMHDPPIWRADARLLFLIVTENRIESTVNQCHDTTTTMLSMAMAVVPLLLCRCTVGAFRSIPVV